MPFDHNGPDGNIVFECCGVNRDEVEAKIKINETQWAQTINAALKNIESKNKVKPFKIKVEATQGKILDEIKKTILMLAS